MYKTAKPLLCTMYRIGNRKQLGAEVTQVTFAHVQYMYYDCFHFHISARLSHYYLGRM